MNTQSQTPSRWLNQKVAEAKKEYAFAAVFVVASAACFAVFCWYLSGFAATWLTDGTLSARLLVQSLSFLTGRYVFAHFASLQNNRAGDAIVSRIKKRAYPVLLQNNRLESTTSALYVTKVADDLKAYFAFFVPYAAASVIVSLSLLMVCFWVEKWVGFVLLLSLLVIPMQMAVIGMGAQSLHKKHIGLFLRYSAVFYNRLQTVAEIVGLGNLQPQYRFLEKKSRALNKATAGVMRVAFLSSTALELFVTISIAAVAIYLGMSLLGIMPGPDYKAGYDFRKALFLLTLTPYFYFYLRKFVSAYHDKNRALAAAELLMPILDAKPVATAVQQNEEPLRSFGIRSLSFVYPNSFLKVLNDINLQFPEKGLVIVKGISGSGKSTLLKICSGSLSVDEGEVSVNGRENAWSCAWLKSNTAYMNQFPFIFDGTLRYNVFLDADADENTPYPDFLENILAKKEDGWQTALSHGGKQLSGGERQLVTLARLLLHPKPVVVLDEPTASLDEETIGIILPQIVQLAQNKLVIVASHEKMFEGVADKVVELNWGEQMGNMHN